MIKRTAIILLIAIVKFAFAQSPDSLNVDKLLLKGKFTEVIEVLSAKDSLTAQEHFKLGKAFMNLMQYSEALKHFSKAVREDANNSEYLYALADAYGFINRPLIAKYFFERVLAIDSTNFSAKIKLAKTFLDIRNYKKAEKLYGEMVERDSLNDYFINRLGFCKIKNGDTTSALRLFNYAFGKGIIGTKTALLLAKIYFSKEKYDSALTVINSALDKDKLNLELNKFAAELYFKLKKYRSAVAKFNQCVILGDSTADLYQKLGLSYYSLANNSDSSKSSNGDFFDEAFKSFTISYKLDNKNPITAMYLGLIYKEKDEYETAVKFFERSLDLIFPSYLDVLLINLGASYELTGDLKNAIKAYKEARKYAPHKAEILFYLGSVYDRYYKDKSVALKYYGKFLSVQKNADEKLVNYAKERMERLKEIIHFSNHR